MATPRVEPSALARAGAASRAASTTDGRITNGALARDLGWFSIGLGLAEFLAPRSLGRMIGVGDGPATRATLRALGLREIATGVGILNASGPRAELLWARAAGDAMDLALLGVAASRPGARRDRIAMAAAAVGGVAVLDVLAARGDVDGASPSRASSGRSLARGLRFTRAVTIRKSAQDLYAVFRNFEQLPSIMSHLCEVRVLDARRSHWVAEGAGVRLAWDAELVKDEAGSLIGWRTSPGSPIEHGGSVRFVAAPGERGTEVHVELYYVPPGGAIGKALAKLLGAIPETQLENDLRRFKQVMETGALVRSDASIHAGAHPARPPARSEETARLQGRAP